jgi:hypothetical protein
MVQPKDALINSRRIHDLFRNVIRIASDLERRLYQNEEMESGKK